MTHGCKLSLFEPSERSTIRYDIVRQKNRQTALQYESETAVFRFVGTPTWFQPGCLGTISFVPAKTCDLFGWAVSSPQIWFLRIMEVGFGSASVFMRFDLLCRFYMLYTILREDLGLFYATFFTQSYKWKAETLIG